VNVIENVINDVLGVGLGELRLGCLDADELVAVYVSLLALW
jgi:hypothetical protein